MLLWHLADVTGFLSDNSSIPTLVSVLNAAGSWFEQGLLFRDVWASFQRASVGIIIGSVLGILLGLATGRNRILYAALGPPLHAARAFPPVAIAPFLILIIGSTGEITKMTIISLGVFFPVWINAHEGAGQVDHGYLEVAKDLEFTKLQRYTRVILPGTLGFCVAGIRNGIAVAYIMVFISEWIASNKGIGYQLSVAHVVSSPEHMAVGLLALGLLAYLTDMAYRASIRFFFPWLESKHG